MRHEAEAQVTGALAGAGQQLIGAATKTTKEFLAALDREISQPRAADQDARERGRRTGGSDGTGETPAVRDADGFARVVTRSPAGTVTAAGQDWRPIVAGRWVVNCWR